MYSTYRYDTSQCVCIYCPRLLQLSPIDMFSELVGYLMCKSKNNGSYHIARITKIAERNYVHCATHSQRVLCDWVFDLSLLLYTLTHTHTYTQTYIYTKL